jgi:thioredoxin 1
LSNVLEVTTVHELGRLINESDDVVVDFAASWCGPCQRLAPHFEKAAEIVEGTTFVKIDIDEAPALANHYGIMSVPTLMRFRNGEQEPVTGKTVVQLVKELS